jgi:hypothetical protein
MAKKTAKALREQAELLLREADMLDRKKREAQEKVNPFLVEVQKEFPDLEWKLISPTEVRYSFPEGRGGLSLRFSTVGTRKSEKKMYHVHVSWGEDFYEQRYVNITTYQYPSIRKAVQSYYDEVKKIQEKVTDRATFLRDTFKVED